MNISEKKFFCSWSGGKDSCLAYYYALEEGAIPEALVTTLIESGERTRAHGLNREVLRKQANSLGTSLFTTSTSWEDYEDNYIALLRELRNKSTEIEMGVFGDIELEEHREWVEKVCRAVDLNAHLPLWQRSRRELVCEFIESGFEALVVAVDAEELDEEFLGRPLDMAFIAELERKELDPSGENGEYHTLVVDGPIFSEPVPYELGDRYKKNGSWYQDVHSD